MGNIWHLHKFIYKKIQKTTTTKIKNQMEKKKAQNKHTYIHIHADIQTYKHTRSK